MRWNTDINCTCSDFSFRGLPLTFSFILSFFVLLQFLFLEAASKPALKSAARLASVLLQVRMVETFRSCFAAISSAEACLDSVFLTFHSVGDLEACIEACFVFVSYTHICFPCLEICFRPRDLRRGALNPASSLASPARLASRPSSCLKHIFEALEGCLEAWLQRCFICW